RGTGLGVELVEGAGAAEGARAALAFVPLEEGAAGGAPGSVRFAVTASDAPPAALIAAIDRWLVGASVAAALLALALALVISAQLGRPLGALALRASRIDWTHLDVRFPTRRLDEVGELARVLNRMTDRLRQGVQRLRDAERR